MAHTFNSQLQYFTKRHEMIASRPLNRPLRLCIVFCAMFAISVGVTSAQDADAVGARLEAAGEKLRAAGEAGKFNSAEEALAEWHKIKERVITGAVAAGEVSEEEADVIRLEMVKAEAAERAKAAAGAPATGRVTAKQMLSYLDKNGDGKISRKEASEELKPFFEQIDANKDGAIDVKEAQVMADYQNSQQSGSTAPASAAARVTAKQIVSDMDKNGDGKITKNEASEDLRLFFDQYDVNKDGAIDVKEAAELEKYANGQQTGSSRPASASGRVTAKQLIGYMDKNGDGKISKDEASEELKPNFQFIDTNGDEVIDVKEAQIMAKHVNEQQGQ